MTNRTRIKICGITNLEDALAAIEYGADALGFILVEGSPRYVGESLEITISRVITNEVCPPFVTRVAVARSIEDVRSAWLQDVDAVQYYEPQRNAWLPVGIRPIRAVRLRDDSSLEELSREGSIYADAILLDAYHPDKLGGSGETFNWELAREAKERFQKPIILAGGLTPENVGDAIRAVRPYAVDVSSGVEASPGKKDHGKLRAFMQAVREADAAIV